MTNNVNITDVGFKNSLKKHNLVYSLIEQVSEKIKSIPQHEKLRVEIELIKTVCLIVENMVSKKNKKSKLPIDKKMLVVDALSAVFSYNDQEKDLVISLINFLFTNDMIKRQSFYKLGKNLLVAWTSSKSQK